jgi:alpha-ketoglutarate-dependent taurine dioxygenase
MNAFDTREMSHAFGIILENSSPGLEPTAISPSIVGEHYRKSAAVLLRGFQGDINVFAEFTSRFIIDCVVNGNDTRDDVVPERHIQTVNTGSSAIPLHSEMAYGPFRPDTLFFYCIAPPRGPGGETLLCDGVEVWSKMGWETRKLFERQCIRYRFRRSRLLGAQSRGREAILYGDARVRHFELHQDGSADLEFLAPAAERAKHLDCAAFANSVIVEDESASFEDGSPITRDLRLELFELTVTRSHKVAWEKGDILMVDNSRMMHGRTRISPDDERRIVIRMGRERNSLFDGGAYP